MNFILPHSYLKREPTPSVNMQFHVKLERHAGAYSLKGSFTTHTSYKDQHGLVSDSSQIKQYSTAHDGHALAARQTCAKAHTRQGLGDPVG